MFGAMEKKTLTLMHRVILGLDGDIKGDHRDGNGLNNRRENLRPATGAQNTHNQRTRIDNRSGVKGVSWHKRIGKWQARIGLHGKDKCLGYFADIQSAAEAYRNASNELHGEFGRTE